MSVCSDCCTIELHNAELNTGGTALFGGKAALAVSNSTLRGLTLEAGAYDPDSYEVAKVMVPMPDVTLSLIASNCNSCTISPFVLNPATVIVNSRFEPGVNETLLSGSVPCDELQRRGVCDRRAVCTDNSSGGRQCDCPSGFDRSAANDGSQIRCIDLCSLARKQPVYVEGSRIALSANRSVVNDSMRLDFSAIVESGDIDPSVATVWLVPKEGVRHAALADTGDLVQVGSTRTGAYELQLRSQGEICTLLDTLHVQCTPGYSAADSAGMPCMPVVNITASDIRIKSSAGEVVFDGRLRNAILASEKARSYALAPIAAGDQLTVEVTVRDIHGAVVSRSTLGLSMVLKGKTTSNKAPFEPPRADGHSSFFVLTVSEMWIPDPGEVESALQLLQSRFAPNPSCVECKM